ncbi:Equilibrative nucleoside transporter 2 [Clonorchis sinensis]|uniref:Equilibrative nucleoside transporter 2 n=1 Tax=Clonorchis sinensis TaxID=79923 RepID=A0A8T1MY75_CLOSI|nr:Equilibrative nucleoside transporter 2 [Clonorchis sinensis]
MNGDRDLLDTHPPRDKFNLAYTFLLLHGVGFLLPWNVFINAKEYFVDYKFNTTLSYDADYRINFMSYLGFAAHFPSLCFSAWNTFYQSGTSSSNPVLRFMVAMLVEITVLLFTIAFTMIDTSGYPGIFFAITIVSVVLINCCVGIHQTLTFGMAAVLPMKYSNAVVVGSNACGTIISVVNILTKWLATVQGRTQKSIIVAAIAYFLSAIAIVITCVVTFFWLRRLRFVLHYANRSRQLCIAVPTIPSIENNEGASVTKPPPTRNDAHSSLVELRDESTTAQHLRPLSPTSPLPPTESNVERSERDALLQFSGSSGSDAVMKSGVDTLRNCFGLCCFSPPIGKRLCREYWLRYTVCFSECWHHCLSIWSVFFCSLSVFPAIQSMVKPVDPNYFIAPLWFVDVTCFLFFNLFAMLGCILCSWIQFPAPRYLWIPIWIRTLFFIPFFLFCNFGLSEPKLPVLVGNDHVYVFGTIIFAFTNGYFSSLTMMYAPRSCPPERAEVAGMLTAFFLTLGVCSGVYASRGFVCLIM